jgi:hypothetical protein
MYGGVPPFIYLGDRTACTKNKLRGVPPITKCSCSLLRGSSNYPMQVLVYMPLICNFFVGNDTEHLQVIPPSREKYRYLRNRRDKKKLGEENAKKIDLVCDQ